MAILLQASMACEEFEVKIHKVKNKKIN